MMGPGFVFVYAFVTFFVVYLVLETCQCFHSNKRDLGGDRGEEPI
jgi:hypothetical protein